jgi:MutS domain V
MKAHLMYPDRDFNLAEEFPPGTDALIDDLELNTLLRAMAAGDDFLFEVSRRALLCGLADPEAITYRQSILADCLEQRAVVREIYDIAVQAILAEKRIWDLMSRSPSAILARAVQVMNIFVEALKRLRALTASQAGDFQSDGFTRFFNMISTELGGEYFAVVEGHLKQLRFPGGVLVSARLGPGNVGMGYVLRKQSTRRTLAGLVPARNRSAYTFAISDGDEAGVKAISDLGDRGINHVANALAQSAGHILGFFQLLRAELAFYIGCLNARERLSSNGEPTCFPVPLPLPERAFSVAGLYDPCLSLTMSGTVIGNDVDADGKPLVMITGANQGGKSTFLRSVGLAQLMMQSGMFVAAKDLRASVCRGLFTHYKREEDAAMESGKLDEELSRMSDITRHITAGSVLLCNESFASTNEREGSQIARQIVDALLESDIRVFFVTHLYDLAQGCYADHAQTALFLRAERKPGGQRTFRLTVGKPLPTSHGKDVYNRIFGADAHAADPGTTSQPRATPKDRTTPGAER